MSPKPLLVAIVGLICSASPVEAAGPAPTGDHWRPGDTILWSPQASPSPWIQDRSAQFTELQGVGDLTPQDEILRFHRAGRALSTGNLDLAEADLTLLLARYPRSFSLHLASAILWRGRKMHAHALHSLDEAVQLLQMGSIEPEAFRHSLHLKQPGSREELVRGDCPPDWVFAVLEELRGSCHLAQKDYDAALRAYDRALKLRPGAAYVLTRRGETLFNLGRHEEALTDFGEAIRSNPRFTDAYLNRLQIWLARRDWLRALDDIAQVQRLDTKDVRVWTSLAFVRMNLNHLVEALIACREAIRLDSGCARAYFLRAAIHDKAARYSEALVDLNKAIQLDPQVSQGHLYRAQLRIRRGDFTGAASDIKIAERQAPDDVDVQALPGDLLAAQRNYQGAVEAYSNAIRGNILAAKLYAARAACYVQLGSLLPALDDCNFALRFQPDLADSYRWRGAVYCKQQKWEAALADLDKYLQLGSAHSDVLGNRGIALHHLGRSREAEAALTKALQLNSAHPELWSCRSAVRVALDLLPEALEDSDEALRHEPLYFEGRLTRNQCLIRLGRYADALSSLNEMIRLNPRSPQLYCERCNLHILCNRSVEAEADIATACTPDPVNSCASCLRLLLAFERGDLVRVMAYLNWIIDEKTPNPRASIFRALCSCALGNPGSAREDAASALSTGATIENMLAQHGLVALANGDRETAMSNAKAELQRKHRSDEAWLLRGLVHLHQEEHALAARDLGVAYLLNPRLFHSRGLAQVVRQTCRAQPAARTR